MSRTVSTLALCAAAGALFAAPALADTSKMKIAFSNNYAGNSWRQAMLKSYDIVTKKAVGRPHRRRGGRLHHCRQGGADPGGADPEPDPAGL